VQNKTINELLHKPSIVGIEEREIVLAKILNVPRVHILAHPELTTTTKQSLLFARLIRRLEKGEPLSYIFGYQTFFELSFFVNKNVLIPRPESEWLVENSLKILQTHTDIKTIIDCGTGSGCLLVSLIKNIPPQIRDKINFFGIDVSRRALNVAKKNEKTNNLNNINWLKGNLLAHLKKLNIADPILLMANLPYLTEKDYKETPNKVRNFEPKLALAGGKDGLKYYKQLITQIKNYSHFTFLCLWEIDPCHSQELADLVALVFTNSKPKIYKDFNGLDRYLSFTTNK